jgi:hypothetical protein
METNMTQPHFGLHDGPNGRARLLSETALAICPTCRRPFTNDEEAARVHARYHEHQQEREREIEERVGRAAAVEAEAAANEAIETLTIQITSLQENQDARISEGIALGVGRAQAKHTADLMLKCHEIDALKAKINDLHRKAEAQTPNLLVDSREVDHALILQAAYKEDDISRIGKGKEGGDILCRPRSKDRNFGCILAEVKNVQTWSEANVVKLRNDMIAAKADYGILAVSKLPPDAEQRLAVRGDMIVSTRSFCRSTGFCAATFSGRRCGATAASMPTPRTPSGSNTD